MIILPAIDIQNGKCVRLYKGDYSTAEKVAENYLETAISFEQSGSNWIHMVDLDGARYGKPVNDKFFINVANSTNLNVEVGGGIRDLKTIEYYLSNGISRVILGSKAVSDYEFTKQVLSLYGEKIVIGIDAKDEMVAVEGWLETSAINYIEFAKSMESIGAKTIVFTDIGKDGTLLGANFEQLARINDTVSCNIIASGGICDIEDIKQLKSMNIYGAICGKSIYSGKLDLKQAVNIGGDQFC